MDSLEQELLQDAEDDARTVEFIKNYLPQEVKDKFTDEELYYFLDVIVEYYANSGTLDPATFTSFSTTWLSHSLTGLPRPFV